MTDTIRVSRELLERAVTHYPFLNLDALEELRALLVNPADGWPTAAMIIRGAEDLRDSLRTFGVEISDGQLRATEIEQEIAESLFRHMLAAAPQPSDDVASEPDVQSELNEKRETIMRLLIELDELKAPRHGHCNHGPEKTCGRCTTERR